MLGLLAEAVDRKALAQAEAVKAARGAEARKKGLTELGHAIHSFVLAVEGEASSASIEELGSLLERHYRVKAGVFKAIGLIPPSLHEQSVELARLLSARALGLKPGPVSRPRKAGRRGVARKKPARKRPGKAKKPRKRRW